jgi:uncharacterized protein involved in high-affinity Fe2+ transport
MKKLMTRTVVALAMVAAVLGSVTAANAGSIFRLYPDRVQTFTAMVFEGQPVRVEVRGDSDPRADLDLYIRDAYGNLVAIDDDDTNFCIGEWVPRFTGVVTIRVVNHGRVYDDYSLVMWGGYFL